MCWGENVSRRLSTEVSMAGRNGRNGTRVVVTGMGAITPIGNSVKEFWASCLAGKSGIGILTSFDHSAYPIHIAGEIKNFDPEEHMDRRDARRMARFSQFAIAATQEAISQAELEMDEVERTRVGVLIGNGIGGLVETQEAVRTMGERGGMKIDPFYYPKMLPNMAAAHIALHIGAKGYNNTVITACAAGTQALGDALDLVRAGRVDVAITGGTEATLCETGLAGFAVIRALSSHNKEPQKASRPFDAERDGFGAAGAVESVAAVQTIQTGMIHPTINYEHPDPECDLDYVPNKARRADVDIVLKNSFGFGGQNACLVFKRYED